IKKANSSSVSVKEGELSTLPVIETEEALLNYFKYALKEQKNQLLKMSDGVEMEAADATSSGSAEFSSSPSNDYSGTNVQVEGIDEADIVKTDGTYIY